MLGEAIERLYGGHLCYGPPIENGYYYDAYMCGCGSDGQHNDMLSSVSASHYPQIESLMKTISSEKQAFERLELSKQELIEMFSYNEFKVRILKEKIPEDRTTVYRCGTLIDLCRGPHVRHTGNVKAFKVTKVSNFLLFYLRQKLYFYNRSRRRPIGRERQTRRHFNGFTAYHSQTPNN